MPEKRSGLAGTSNQRMNSYLKEIADICGINKPLSTHVAKTLYIRYLIENQIVTSIKLITGNDLETSELQYSVFFCLCQRTILSMQIYTLLVTKAILFHI